MSRPAPADDVLGYVQACAICGQRAVTRTRHRDWVCPDCLEVADPAYAIAASEDRVAEQLHDAGFRMHPGVVDHRTEAGR